MNLETIPCTQLHQYLGAVADPQGGCHFAVWAPLHDQVDVDLVDQKRRVTMQKRGSYHVAFVDGVTAGDRYYYRIGEGPPRPDPASRFQRDGVHGASEVVSRDFAWSDRQWKGIARDDLVIYELHIGTFTEAGTYDGAIERLDELVDLGINAVELMPVAESAGRWNWGYDGVSLFAPTRNFGTPDELRRFVDTAHAKGLAVILDVVYNHLGPEGNYWSEFGPFLSTRHQTTWGAAPNFDDPTHGRQLRRFFIANVIHWFDEYHFDGLRVDAIHCMADDSDPHIATEIAMATGNWVEQTGRSAMLIAETNVYNPEMLVPIDRGGNGFDAQWCDDFLHSVFAVVRPGERLCDRPYLSDNDLNQTLRMGYVYAGTLHRDRQRCPASSRVETHGMVYSIQNHDFIGNHPLGQRFHQLTSIDTQKAAAALLILSPAIPMLFMGEEFACERPFRFFVDFGDERLRQAVVAGRKREYPQHDWSSGILPIDPQAFHGSKIGPASEGNAQLRDWYRTLIDYRKKWRTSGLLRDENLRVESDVDRGLYSLYYQTPRESVEIHVRLVDILAVEEDCPLDPTGQLMLDSRGESDTKTLRNNHAKIFAASSDQQ